MLSNEDVLQLIDPAAWIDALDVAFRDLASGVAVNRPRSMTYTDLGDGHWYIMRTVDGSLPRHGVHALRVGSDHTHEFSRDGRRRREKLGVAPGGRFVGFVMLFDTHSLEPLAIVQDGDMQRWLVGCTSALAARHLARQDARDVALIGSGWQAETQIQALRHVRQIERIRAYSTNLERLRDFCDRMTDVLGQEVRPAPSAREAVDGSDVVVCATNSRDPVIDGAWIRQGHHINAVLVKELDRGTLERADIVAVRDRQASTAFYPVSSEPPHDAREPEVDDWLERKVIDLGRVVAGEVGRTSNSDITVFPSSIGASSGLGMTFAAVTHVVYRAALAKGIGRELPTEWFTESAKP